VVDLALGERPELDDLHPARQRIGKVAQRQNLGGPGEQEASWPRVGIDGHLDRAKEFWCQLDFVNYKKPVVLDEIRWIILCRA